MGWLGKAWSRGAVYAAIGLAAALIAAGAYATGTLRSTELSTQDKRFQVRGEQEPSGDIVIVGLDEETFTRLKETNPLPRSLHARAIRRLTAAGAAQIAYDIQFTEPTKPEEDSALINAVADAGHVVLATTEVNDDGTSNVFGGVDAQGNDVLESIGARAGDSTYKPTPGGVARRVDLAPDGLDSFAVATVESQTEREIGESTLPDGRAWVDYRGGPGTFPTYSLVDLLRGRIPQEKLSGKTVLVGATAANLQDLHPHPFDDGLMPGVEFHANAIDTIARGAPLRSTPVAIDLLLIVLLAAAAAAFNMRLRPLPAAGLTLLAALLYLAFAQLAFNSGRIVPVVYPLLGLTVSGVGSLGAQYIFTAFDRQRTHDTFARFVGDSVVGEVMSRADGLKLGGRREEVTVLFSDIRGFTTFSESRPPEEVLEVLNRYLTEMTEAVLNNGGTLSSFIGDGIMAVFGAPIEQEDHADRALAAAREMLGPRLGAFNEWATARDVDPFQIGVGLNSGPVMAGMVGSERRLDYTAIGDTVNTASRLEGATKGTEHPLFIAESTRSRLKAGMDDLEFVDEVPIRGRALGIKVYTDPPLSRREAQSEEPARSSPPAPAG